jgi:hypothetical protein
MKRILFFAAAAALVVTAGCATKAPPELTMRDDPRAGTEDSPYRSMPVAIQCDDCRYVR